MATHKFPKPWQRVDMLEWEPEFQRCTKCGMRFYRVWGDMECPGKPPPEEPESQTTTEPSAGAVEAANEWFHYAYGPTNILVCRLTEIIDRLAVRPAVAAAEAEVAAYEQAIVSNELGRDAEPEGVYGRATELATRIHRLQEPLEDENDRLEAQRDRLREALIGARDRIFMGVCQPPAAALYIDKQEDRELLGKIAAALGEEGE